MFFLCFFFKRSQRIYFGNSKEKDDEFSNRFFPLSFNFSLKKLKLSCVCVSFCANTEELV